MASLIAPAVSDDLAALTTASLHVAAKRGNLVFAKKLAHAPQLRRLTS